MRGGCALAALALLSCRSPTQVTFEVTTDVPCGEHRGTNLSVGRLGEVDERPTSSTKLECDPATGRIGSVVVVPSGDKGDEIAARFVLGIGKSPERCVEDGFKGGCIVARRALRFIAHEPLVVSVPMRNECRDVVCPTGQTCIRGTCVGAQVDPAGCTGAGCGEEALATPADAGVDAAPDGGIDAAPDSSFTGKRVFVTSTTYTGNLGGAAGADAKCQAVADAVPLPGTYRAWISDATSSPSTRFARSGPYALVDGTLVANDWAELTSGTLRHAIDKTETGGPPPAGSGTFCSGSTQPLGAWSGTSSNGTKSGQDSCAGFTNGAFAFTSQVEFGDPTATSTAWTTGRCLNAGATYCAKQAPLYCFEQ